VEEKGDNRGYTHHSACTQVNTGGENKRGLQKFRNQGFVAVSEKCINP